MSIKLIDVRDDRGGWAEFFINEREPVKQSDGHFRYTATWVVYSSFGVFGHQWSDMGMPFVRFVQDVDDGYLLSKIGRKVPSSKLTCSWVRNEILLSRRERHISADAARYAMDAVDDIECDYGNAEVPIMLYENVAISEAVVDWHDCPTTDWDTQVVMFVK